MKIAIKGRVVPVDFQSFKQEILFLEIYPLHPLGDAGEDFIGDRA